MNPQRAVIIGAGTMGLGIAECFATAGLDVLLIDASPELLGDARTAEKHRHRRPAWRQNFGWLLRIQRGGTRHAVAGTRQTLRGAEAVAGRTAAAELQAERNW